MIYLADLADHIFLQTGYACKEAPERLPEETTTETSPILIYVDYAAMKSPIEEAIMVNSSSQVGTEIVLLVSISCDAPLSAYPEVLLNLHRACEGYQPHSDIQNIRVFTFVEADFIRDNQRRVTKQIWAVTYDRFIN